MVSNRRNPDGLQLVKSGPDLQIDLRRICISKNPYVILNL